MNLLHCEKCGRVVEGSEHYYRTRSDKQKLYCKACYTERRLNDYNRLRNSVWKQHKAGFLNREKYFKALKKLDNEYLRDPQLKS